MDETQGKLANIGATYIRTAGDGSFVFAPKESLGVIFLGILALILLIALQHAHSRNRELMSQLAQNRQASRPE